MDQRVADPFAARRDAMVEQQIVRRGVRNALVLRALGQVPREVFVPEELRDFAYDDAPLPIGAQQTISQPYIVALMVEALGLRGGERVLEIGTGSGYAAAVLAQIAGEVYTVERHQSLTDDARRRLTDLGYRNAHVRCGDGTLGWPEAAPFDAIVVAAGGPQVPESLQTQLAPGGRLVVPVGAARDLQHLTRVTRGPGDAYTQENLGPVRFVPLIGAEGWADKEKEDRPHSTAISRRSLPELIAAHAQPLADIEQADLGPLLDRVGTARLVLIGEASHGTSEFYRLRARITRALIEHKGFRIVAAEADWPDAARIDSYVRHRDVPPSTWTAFARFPTWMWRNHEVREFVDWLHARNAGVEFQDRVAFYGLDLYSLSSSIAAVLAWLDRTDPDLAVLARERYGCLTPWQSDPVIYGRMALNDRYRGCTDQVQAMLRDLLDQRLEAARRDGEAAFDAIENARVVADAERYYRAMYLEPHQSWNLRDRHMYETLEALLATPAAPGNKAVVWAHNSHLGDARATEMSARGEWNLGQLCREHHGEAAYLIGFGTHCGTVAAANDWDGPMQVMQVRPSHARSYERQFHDSHVPACLLGLRHADAALHAALMEPRLERAIGVIYRPTTELASHYFEAVLPRQFDEYLWFDTTRAVQPLDTADLHDVPQTYPFGL